MTVCLPRVSPPLPTNGMRALKITAAPHWLMRGQQTREIRRRWKEKVTGSSLRFLQIQLPWCLMRPHDLRKMMGLLWRYLSCPMWDITLGLADNLLDAEVLHHIWNRMALFSPQGCHLHWWWVAADPQTAASHLGSSPCVCVFLFFVAPTHCCPEATGSTVPCLCGPPGT